RSDASFEHGAKCSVIVANEILRCRVPWECFSDLARQPLGRRVAGHRKPQQLPTFVAKNKKCEELLKRDRRNHEQINRRNPPPYDCEGRSSKSAMADPAAVPCRRKPWTGRPRCRV